MYYLNNYYTKKYSEKYHEFKYLNKMANLYYNGIIYIVMIMMNILVHVHDKLYANVFDIFC